MTDTPEAVRLADDLTQLASEGAALIHLQSGAYICQKFAEAAALLRRIPELEADYQRLMDKHNALHINALASRRRISELEAERDQLRAELEKVSVLYTQPAAPTPPNADQKGQ